MRKIQEEVGKVLSLQHSRFRCLLNGRLVFGMKMIKLSEWITYNAVIVLLFCLDTYNVTQITFYPGIEWRSYVVRIHALLSLLFLSLSICTGEAINLVLKCINKVMFIVHTGINRISHSEASDVNINFHLVSLTLQCCFFNYIINCSGSLISIFTQKLTISRSFLFLAWIRRMKKLLKWHDWWADKNYAALKIDFYFLQNKILNYTFGI